MKNSATFLRTMLSAIGIAATMGLWGCSTQSSPPVRAYLHAKDEMAAALSHCYSEPFDARPYCAPNAAP